jgi:hypothetical protein
MSLRHVRLASALQCPAVDKVEDNAVGQLLTILIRWVWRAELAEVEALDDALFVGLGGAQDEVARRVDLNPSAFPEQSVGELNVEVAYVH